VGEGGRALSMGQRQLLAFMRVLVYDPCILVLDEATASLDPATEALVKQATKKLLSNRTAIIIAHRLSTIQDTDYTLVLHQGEVKEQGNHKDLLAKKGYYAALYEAKPQVA
jgi:ATP-binding cassette subfamily B multidrug efflux pump